MRSALLEHFKPEFVNRLDDVVRFESLSREQLSEIVELQVRLVLRRVAERGVEVTLTDKAKELLGNLGYDPVYGARPLRAGDPEAADRPPRAGAAAGRDPRRRQRAGGRGDGELRLEPTGAQAETAAVGVTA